MGVGNQKTIRYFQWTKKCFIVSLFSIERSKTLKVLVMTATEDILIFLRKLKITLMKYQTIFSM